MIFKGSKLSTDRYASRCEGLKFFDLLSGGTKIQHTNKLGYVMTSKQKTIVSTFLVLSIISMPIILYLTSVFPPKSSGRGIALAVSIIDMLPIICSVVWFALLFEKETKGLNKCIRENQKAIFLFWIPFVGILFLLIGAYISGRQN